MKPPDLDQMLATAVLEMARETSMPATVDRVVQLATETIPSCDAAALKVLQQGVPSVLAVTDPVLADLLEPLHRGGSAPIFDAYRDGAAIYMPDLSAETRWATYTKALSDWGIHTVHVLPLASQDRPIGVLDLYAKSVDAFDEEDKAVTGILVAHATAALSDAVGQVQMQTALDSRTVIGQATGMLMERFGLGPDAAFGVLRRLSQSQNIKIRDLATQVVETGEVPQAKRANPSDHGNL